MALPITGTDSADSRQSNDEITSRLRSLAQSHLGEIEQDKETEAKDALTAEQQLLKYTKVKRKERIAIAKTNPPTYSEAKGSKLRSAADILDRLQWDSTYDITQYRVGYLERFEGLKEMPATSWIREPTDEDWIPQHRIKYIKRVDSARREIVWDRDERLDRIFGSGRRSKDDFDDESVDGASVVGGVDL